MKTFAPGRVNLIGEHTDYNLGFVLPIAINLGCEAVAEPSADGRLTVHSRNRDETRSWLTATLAAAKPSGDWTDYVVGVARLIPGLRPVHLTVSSNFPTGAGLSSSAALEVSSALALGSQERGVELARLCRRAENEFAGVPCGIMDQYASVAGVEGAAILIDCRSLESRPVQLPPGVAIFAFNSMVKHDLGVSAYSERVRECAEASRFLGIASLRDATLAGAESIPDPTVRRRARHIVTENQRVLDFVHACDRNDTSMLGELFFASHRSMRDDYEISCPEIDFLVDTARQIPGIIGARMTGGGFGGCTVNLVEQDKAQQAAATLRDLYHQKYGFHAEVYHVHPSTGARIIG